MRQKSIKDAGHDFGPITDQYTTSADASSGVAIGPAPSTGEYSELIECTVSSDTAMLVTLRSETTAGAERIVFRVPADGTVRIVRRIPKRLPIAGKKWYAYASAAGNIYVETVTRSVSAPPA